VIVAVAVAQVGWVMEIVGAVGTAFTVTTADPLRPDPEHPLASVTLTSVYVFVDAGLTLIELPLV
jgi:hypothetical protein